MANDSSHNGNIFFSKFGHISGGILLILHIEIFSLHYISMFNLIERRFLTCVTSGAEAVPKLPHEDARTFAHGLRKTPARLRSAARVDL